MTDPRSTPSPETGGLLRETNQRRATRVQGLATLNAAVIAVIAAITATAAIMQGAWQYQVIAGVFMLAALLSILAHVLAQHGSFSIAGALILAADIAAFSVPGLLITDISVWMAATILLLTIIIAWSSLEWLQSSFTILIGMLVAIVALLADNLELSSRITVPGLDAYITIVPGVLLVILGVISLARFSSSSLQIKILSAFLVTVILPVTLIAFVNIRSMRTTIRSQASHNLSISADLTAASLDDFFELNLERTAAEAGLPAFIDYLSLPVLDRRDSHEENKVLAEITALRVKQRDYIDSYALLDRNGRAIFDTYYYPLYKGIDESGTDCFLNAMKTGKEHVTPVIISPVSKMPSISFCSPIRAPNNSVIGVLRVRYHSLALQDILKRFVAVAGQTSYPILFDENLIRLADTQNPTLIYMTLTPLDPKQVEALQGTGRLPQPLPDVYSTNQADFATKLINRERNALFTTSFVTDREHREVVAVSQTKYQPWTVAFLQEEAVILAPAEAQKRSSIQIAGMIVAIVTGLGVVSSRMIARPIADLTETAGKVTAGDLESRASVRSNDEIGMLGNAFNVMTAQLRGLIGSLEQRVAERTRELEKQSDRMRYRAAQLQTVADVARAVTSIQDLEELLESVTHLVSDRFGFYHAGIFLLDATRQNAILRAANSEGGRRMLERHHALKVGEVGIVGYVTGTGHPRIATDVGEDAAFFNNPDLPETRSEMALPLQIGGQVIGALDVQSTEANAFTEDDVTLFSTLADQVAIAIDNNRLYSETRSALDEARGLHRQYLQQEWSRELYEEHHPAYQYSASGVRPSEAVDLPEIQNALASGEVAYYRAGQAPGGARNPAASRSAVAVPIKLRGQTIGVLNLQEFDPNREWTEDEVSFVRGVADQIGLALENARLFRQTVRRANRERKVLEITSRIRSTNDPREMLQVAADEIQRALGASRAQIVLKSLLPASDPTGANGPDGDGNGNGSGD